VRLGLRVLSHEITTPRICDNRARSTRSEARSRRNADALPVRARRWSGLPLSAAVLARAGNLIVSEGKTVGFALIRRLTDQPSFAMTEFYVLPADRRLGIGRAVATQIFAAHPGLWRVAVLPTNSKGLVFWASVLPPNCDVAREPGPLGELTCFYFATQAIKAPPSAGC
jgi:predicted acetyltransferase